MTPPSGSVMATRLSLASKAKLVAKPAAIDHAGLVAHAVVTELGNMPFGVGLADQPIGRVVVE